MLKKPYDASYGGDQDVACDGDKYQQEVYSVMCVAGCLSTPFESFKREHTATTFLSQIAR